MVRFVWDEKILYKTAAQYSSRSEFKAAYPSAYSAARKLNILDKICGHMSSPKKPSGYWNLKNLKSEARKYKTRTEFAENSQGAYTIAKKKGLLDQICGHMILKGNRFYRAIYVFEFENNAAYIGLSYDLEKRYTSHLNSGGPVGRMAKKTKFKFQQLTEYVPRKSAKELEAFFLDEYRKNGWIILNTAKAGALGSGERKITLAFLKSEIAKYEYLKDFAKNSPSAYATAKKNNHHKLFSHLKRLKMPDGKLTKNHCRKIAKTCLTKSEFKEKFPSEYSTCVRKSWLKDLCKHMSRPKPANLEYDFDRCMKDASKCTNSTDFRNKFPGSFNASHRRNWYKKITKHFLRINKTPISWTFDMCLKKARNFTSKAEFRKSEYNAYKFASKHQYLKRIESICGWNIEG